MSILGFQLTGYQVAFVILAGVTLLAAVAVVLLPNILRAALCLGLALLGIAGLYVLLNAPFLAVVQVMVYVGGITTMIILAVFVSHRVMNVRFPEATYNPILAAGVAGLMFLFLFVSVVCSVWVWQNTDLGGPASVGIGVTDIARGMIQTYAFPFELVSVVLLAVLVGAIVIAKEDSPDES